MATNTQATSVIDAVKDLSKQVKALTSNIDEALRFNTMLGLNWNNLASSNPELVGGGLVVGESVSPADVSNALGSLAAIQTLYAGGDGTNLEKFSLPVV